MHKKVDSFLILLDPNNSNFKVLISIKFLVKFFFFLVLFQQQYLALKSPPNGWPMEFSDKIFTWWKHIWWLVILCATVTVTAATIVFFNSNFITYATNSTITVKEYVIKKFVLQARLYLSTEASCFKRN